jgi:ribonucleotide monophosphatase NagD (HAD superfamily)
MTVQNKKTPIEANPADDAVNKTVQKSTQAVFEQMVKLDNLSTIANTAAKLLIEELKNASFMTENLELDERQKEKIIDIAGSLFMRAADSYIDLLNKDDKTKKITALVETSMRNVVEEALSAIAETVNRGAIISSVAVKADAKRDDYNSIELNHSKIAGDITIPTKGIFIATNCVNVIQRSCFVKNEVK